jgi:hypothetical protein
MLGKVVLSRENAISVVLHADDHPTLLFRLSLQRVGESADLRLRLMCVLPVGVVMAQLNSSLSAHIIEETDGLCGPSVFSDALLPRQLFLSTTLRRKEAGLCLRYPFISSV